MAMNFKVFENSERVAEYLQILFVNNLIIIQLQLQVFT